MNTTAMITPCNPANDTVPRLIVDLTDLVLIYAIRLHVGASHDYRRTSHDLGLIHTLLTAADPEAHRADLVCAAIMPAWWMDLDWASERRQLHLLDCMVDLHRSGRRPLQYSLRGIDRAARRGFFDVVKWWSAQNDGHVRLPGVATVPFGKGLAGQGQEDFDLVFGWALSRFDDSFLSTVLEAVIKEAIMQGNSHILEYLLPYLVSNQVRFEIRYGLFRGLAQVAGERKQAWTVEWIARHLCQGGPSVGDAESLALDGPFTVEGCHQHAFLGSISSGSLELVQQTYAQWETHAPSSYLPGDFDTSVNLAGVAGQLDVLQWLVGKLQNASDSLHIDLDPIGLKGHVHVLEWWTTVGVNLVQGAKLVSNCPNILYQLTRRGLTRVVQWWVTSSGMPFESGEPPIVAAAKYGNVELLEWWEARLRSESGRMKRGSLRFTLTALEQASVQGHVDVLQWWRLNNKPFPDPLLYGPFDIVKRACQAGRLDVLQWWHAHIIEATDSSSLCIWTDENCMLQLIQESQGSQLDVFDWLADLWARAFGKPAKLHFNNMTTIHPLLAKVYHSRGYELSLSRQAQRRMVKKCIQKGYVLVLRDLVCWEIVECVSQSSNHSMWHQEYASLDCGDCVDEWIWGRRSQLHFEG